MHEGTGDIQSSWVNVTTAAGSSLLRLSRETKMAAFWTYFRDFIGEQKIKDLSESKTFFPEIFQIMGRFILAKKIGHKVHFKYLKQQGERVVYIYEENKSIKFQVLA